MQADVNSSSLRVERVAHSHLHSFDPEHVAKGFPYDNKLTIQYVVHGGIRKSFNVQEQIVSPAAFLTKLKHMPVTCSANMIRVDGTCMNQGVEYQRLLEYHATKDTLMMIVDTGAEIHVVCEKDTENDCTAEPQ